MTIIILPQFFLVISPSKLCMIKYLNQSGSLFLCKSLIQKSGLNKHGICLYTLKSIIQKKQKTHFNKNASKRANLLNNKKHIKIDITNKPL